jgi:hypothetical protein
MHQDFGGTPFATLFLDGSQNVQARTFGAADMA